MTSFEIQTIIADAQDQLADIDVHIHRAEEVVHAVLADATGLAVEYAAERRAYDEAIVDEVAAMAE
jgi:hypothetical protein